MKELTVLLEPASAFVFTITAFAIVVAMIVEIYIRLQGFRKKNQISLIKRLYDDLLAPIVSVNPPDSTKRWEFVCRVLENPFADRSMALSEDVQRFSSLDRSAIHDEVDVEHFLRCGIEVLDAEANGSSPHLELRTSLTRLAQKFDEYSSGMAVRFSENVRKLSLVVGVVLAVVANIDGVRLFEFYTRDSELGERIDSLASKLSMRKAQLEHLRSEVEYGSIAEGALEDLDDTFDSIDPMEPRLVELLAVASAGLPMGRLFYPHCRFLTDEEALKRSADALCTASYDWLSSLTWTIKVVLTGLLIGTGGFMVRNAGKWLAAAPKTWRSRGLALRRDQLDALQRIEFRKRLVDELMQEMGN